MDLRLETHSMVDAPISSMSPRLAPVPRMQGYLTERLHASEVPNGSFWCEEDLRQLWSNEDHAQAILYFENEDLKRAQKDFFKILSVLIHIGRFDREIFKARFFIAGFNDAGLPFAPEWLSDTLGRTAGQLFHDNQFMSIPLYIDDEELATIRRVKSGMRWPFKDRPELIGSGGYGDVFRAEVPSQYIRTLRRSGDKANVKVSLRFGEDSSRCLLKLLLSRNTLLLRK